MGENINKALFAGGCAGASLAFMLGLNTTMDSMLISPTEQNGQIQPCARLLGQTATRVSIVPEECQEYVFAFDSKTVRVGSFDPVTHTRTASITEEYTLPSHDDFERDFGATDVTIQSFDKSKRVNKGISRAMGVLMLFSLLSTPKILDVLDKRSPRLARTLPASVR